MDTMPQLNVDDVDDLMQVLHKDGADNIDDEVAADNIDHEVIKVAKEQEELQSVEKMEVDTTNEIVVYTEENGNWSLNRSIKMCIIPLVNLFRYIF